MNCKHEYAEMCCNADCPYCGDFCPCAEHQEICKYAEDKDGYTDEELMQIDPLT